MSESNWPQRYTVGVVNNPMGSFKVTLMETQDGELTKSNDFNKLLKYIVDRSLDNSDYVDMSYEQIAQEILNKVGEVKK
jgi:hypothetical protein